MFMPPDHLRTNVSFGPPTPRRGSPEDRPQASLPTPPRRQNGRAAPARCLCRDFASSVRSSSLPHRSTGRSEEHTSELQSLMRISYAVFCLKKKKNHIKNKIHSNLYVQQLN